MHVFVVSSLFVHLCLLYLGKHRVAANAISVYILSCCKPLVHQEMKASFCTVIWNHGRTIEIAQRFQTLPIFRSLFSLLASSKAKADALLYRPHAWEGPFVTS